MQFKFESFLDVNFNAELGHIKMSDGWADDPIVGLLNKHIARETAHAQLPETKQEEGLTNLLRDLDAIPEDKRHPTIAKIRQNALFGHYSDFMSHHAMPEYVLIAALQKAGHPELAQKVVDGDYEHGYVKKPKQ